MTTTTQGASAAEQDPTEKAATITAQLAADSGYTAMQKGRISAEQWGKICAVIAGTDASQPVAPVAPEGYVLVPKAMTDEMRDAGNVIVLDRGKLVQIWRAMVAASPQVEVAQPKDHEIREAVNRLRDIAVEFHAHQSLRDRLAAIVLPLARAGAAQVEVAPQAGQGITTPRWSKEAEMMESWSQAEQVAKADAEHDHSEGGHHD